MIFLYSGTPGSGKSLHVASVIYWQIKRGLPAICNFEMNLDSIKGKRGYFKSLDNDEMQPSKLIKFSRHYFQKHKFSEDKILLVIDECQLLFNCREWNAQGRKEWMSFFTQHRKYGYKVILIAQFDRMVDRQIRSLIEYNIVHRKVSNFGMVGKIISLLSGCKLFVAVKIWYPLNQKVESQFFKAKKQYYSLYDSYKHFEIEETKSNVLPMQSARK